MAPSCIVPITTDAINGISVLVKYGTPIFINIANSIAETSNIGSEIDFKTNNISINIISHTDKLKRWKMKKISVLLEYYTRVYETVSKIIYTNSVDSIEKIKFDKEYMKYEEDFICEYHKELQDICSLLTHIKKMNNVTNERNKKLCKKFNEKVLRNNN